ncbi:contractile injection system tape measure protein [Vannielia litorea]|uniref:contractile injection system tape measure protein n=1 Tax=Vannielia litorea TaxID=1217970 RepID=UPI001BCBF145|nr:contractile injection system tape measure protein [Vannielia litorea]MBS8226338.1 hypothetical protein [Vannielia litorea]
MSEHSVGRMVFDLETGGVALAEQVQARVSRHAALGLPEVLEAGLAGHVRRIDRLEVDIGRVPLSGLEAALDRGLEAALADRLGDACERAEAQIEDRTQDDAAAPGAEPAEGPASALLLMAPEEARAALRARLETYLGRRRLALELGDGTFGAVLKHLALAPPDARERRLGAALSGAAPSERAAFRVALLRARLAREEGAVEALLPQTVAELAPAIEPDGPPARKGETALERALSAALFPEPSAGAAPPFAAPVVARALQEAPAALCTHLCDMATRGPLAETLLVALPEDLLERLLAQLFGRHWPALCTRLGDSTPARLRVALHVGLEPMGAGDPWDRIAVRLSGWEQARAVESVATLRSEPEATPLASTSDEEGVPGGAGEGRRDPLGPMAQTAEDTAGEAMLPRASSREGSVVRGEAARGPVSVQVGAQGRARKAHTAGHAEARAVENHLRTRHSDPAWEERRGRRRRETNPDRPVPQHHEAGPDAPGAGKDGLGARAGVVGAAGRKGDERKTTGGGAACVSEGGTTDELGPGARNWQGAPAHTGRRPRDAGGAAAQGWGEADAGGWSEEGRLEAADGPGPDAADLSSPGLRPSGAEAAMAGSSLPEAGVARGAGRATRRDGNAGHAAAQGASCGALLVEGSREGERPGAVTERELVTSVAERPGSAVGLDEPLPEALADLARVLSTGPLPPDMARRVLRAMSALALLPPPDVTAALRRLLAHPPLRQRVAAWATPAIARRVLVLLAAPAAAVALCDDLADLPENAAAGWAKGAVPRAVAAHLAEHRAAPPAEVLTPLALLRRAMAERLAVGGLHFASLRAALGAAAPVGSVLAATLGELDELEALVPLVHASSAAPVAPEPPAEGLAPTWQTPVAGVVLLWPFLARFFDGLGLSEEGRFRGPAARWRGALLVQHLATGQGLEPQGDMALPKVLCGLPPEEILPEGQDLSPAEDDLAQGLIGAVLGHLAARVSLSPEALRGNYLARAGHLDLGPSPGLSVAHRPWDALLAALPWPMGVVSLPSMKRPLPIAWRLA